MKGCFAILPYSLYLFYKSVLYKMCMIWAALEHGYNFFNERMLQHGYLPPGAGVGTVQILVSQATSYDKSVSTWFPYVRSTLVSGRLSSIFNLTQAVKHLNNQHGTPYFGI